MNQNKWRRGSKHPLYNTWKSMMQRCYLTTHSSYAFYGLRGIFVCDRWKNFDNFVQDIGYKPQGLTMDRINNDGNYCLGNIRWADKKEQQRNMRTNVNISYDGQRKCVTAWAESKGINPETLRRRLKNGTTIGDALEKQTPK